MGLLNADNHTVAINNTLNLFTYSTSIVTYVGKKVKTSIPLHNCQSSDFPITSKDLFQKNKINELLCPRNNSFK